MPPKKGKVKAGGGGGSSSNTPSSSSSGKKKGGISSIGSTAPADSDFIVFTNSTKESSGGGRGKARGGGGAGAAGGGIAGGTASGGTAAGGGGGPDASATDGPPKPTVKQIIGGASWTGKLPVNMLSEHCQKQKWDKPDYDVRKVKDGFSAFVSLSARNTKTGEVTRLDPFKLPPSHVHLAIQPTALEARHFAATYGLFRVCSMKNLHMMLPPTYKSLWREFGTLKAQDVRDGRAWMYEADPFVALRERELAKATAEKKRLEQQAAREKAASRGGLEGAGGTLGRGGGGGGSGGAGGAGGSGGSGGRGGGGGESRAWSNNIPQIEMGSKTRTNLEDLLRRGSVWNPQGVVMTAAAQRGIVDELVKLGFRASHVEEAVALCQDRAETLEWLLVHVPEDDLPRWALPESYTAGVSVAATDLRREAAIVRLAQSGYALDLCRKMLDASGGDEGQAAARLQVVLVGPTTREEDEKEEKAAAEEAMTPAASSYDSANECWEAELASLESVFGTEQFRRPAESVCEIQLSGVVNVVQGTARDVTLALQFRRSPAYPAELLVAAVAPQLPAYIRLSIVRQVLAHAHSALRGEEMKMYFVADWAQQHVNSIIERPGRLRDIAAAASAASETTADGNRASALAGAAPRKRAPRHPRPIAWTPDNGSRQAWLRRQEAPAYQKMLAQRRRLPAWEAREAVVDAVREHQVTIIAGETGSGKSTQSPQFLLDDLYSRGLGSAANIVVTQPRRISALGLAERVSEERCCGAVGEEVGYIIRGESRVAAGRGSGRGARTARITFVTTGVLLRRLQVSGGRPEDVVAALADVSHVIIDEVHERSLDTDFLLSILRDVLRQRADLKLVLMSATLDAATFRDYFARDGLSVASVEISGRTFPVEDLYLDDVIRATGFGLDGTARRSGGRRDGRRPGADGGGGDDDNDDDPDPVAKAIQRLGSRINYALVADTVKAIDEELARTGDTGAVLVFLPGVAEINQVCGMLGGAARSGGSGGGGGGGDSDGSSLYVLPLHAGLETREQKRVFAAAPTGLRKVVVATNVAETSITIDDVVAVVDTGRVKETSLDAQTGMRRLAETWVSLAAAKQRRGRAGRVRPGHCYKLYTRALESQQMPPRPEPEIRRVPLEQLCLAVRAMGIPDVAAFLARAPSPPDVAAVDGALVLLRRMGILVEASGDSGDGGTGGNGGNGGNSGRNGNGNGNGNGANGRDTTTPTATTSLTALGRLVAAIPADLRCAKLMVYGALFGCLHPCVTIAAILSSGRAGGPFASVPPDRREEAKAARMRFAAPGPTADGDLLTDLRAVLRWDDVVSEHRGTTGRAGRGGGSIPFYSYPRPVRNFCDDNFLSQQALADISATRQQLYDAMADLGIRPEPSASTSLSSSSSSSSSSLSFPLLRALTAAAFNPQIARIQLPDQKFAASVSGTVALDPEARTIRYFSRDQGRVFIHPSSTLFDSQGFGGRAVFLSYFTSMATSKVFVRDLTPFNAYTLLMFAGDIDLDTLGRGLIVDGWLRLRGWARIGVLVSRLRGMVDRLIARRLGQGDSEDEADRADGTAAGRAAVVDTEQIDKEILKAVVKLIELDGLDS